MTVITNSKQRAFLLIGGAGFVLLYSVLSMIIKVCFLI